MAPVTPTLMTDFFASRRSKDGPVKCEAFPPSQQPDYCLAAYSDVVFWSTCTSFFSNSVLTFLMVSAERQTQQGVCDRLHGGWSLLGQMWASC
jgi:hypothetical protein